VAPGSSGRAVDHSSSRSSSSKAASSASTQTLAASSAPAPAPASAISAGANAGSEKGFLGLPTGKSAAVPIPKHKMTSDESHQKLEGYFSGVSLNFVQFPPSFALLLCSLPPAFCWWHESRVWRECGLAHALSRVQGLGWLREVLGTLKVVQNRSLKLAMTMR
jgi:hypothetical protein